MISVYAKVYYAADSRIGDTMPHLPFDVRWVHDQQWMLEIKSLAELQQRDVAPAPAPILVVPEVDASVGRVRVNWFAIGFGAAAAFYLAGLFWLVSWIVPELVEFTR